MNVGIDHPLPNDALVAGPKSSLNPLEDFSMLAQQVGLADVILKSTINFSYRWSTVLESGGMIRPTKATSKCFVWYIGKKLLTCYLLSQTKVNLSLFSLSNLKILFLATNDFCEKIFLLLLTCTPIRRCSKFVFHRILPMAPQPCWEDDFDHRIVSANCILESHNKNDDGFEGLVLSNKRVQAYSTQTNDQAEAKFCWQSYEKLLRWKNFFGLCVCCLN